MARTRLVKYSWCNSVACIIKFIVINPPFDTLTECCNCIRYFNCLILTCECCFKLMVYMIYRLINCQMLKRGSVVLTKLHGRFREMGCQSIQRLVSGVPLGFNKSATVSVSSSKERLFKKWLLDKRIKRRWVNMVAYRFR